MHTEASGKEGDWSQVAKGITVQSLIENLNQAETSVTECDRKYRLYSDIWKVSKQAKTNSNNNKPWGGGRI